MSATLATPIPRRRLFLFIFSIFMLLGAVSLSQAAAASADTLVVTTSPSASDPAQVGSGVTRGNSVTVTVTAQNGGVTDTGYTGTVKLSSDPSDTWAADGDANSSSFTAPSGTSPYVPGSYTFTSGDGGVASFTVTVNATAGTAADTLTAKDNADSNVSDEGTATLNVYKPSLTVTSTADSPSDVITAGSTTVTVAAFNHDGTPDTTYTGTVALSSANSDTWAKTDADHGTSFTAPAYASSTYTPGAYTFVATDHGVATFNVTVNVTVSSSLDGTDPLKATDPNVTTTAANTDTITVVGAVSQYAVSDNSSDQAVDGSMVVVTATAEDAAGNVVTSDQTSDVTLLSAKGSNGNVVNDNDTPLSQSATTINGVATFDITVNGLKKRTFTATDGSGNTGSELFTDVAGPVSQFAVTDTNSGHEIDGTTITVTATAVDAAGNDVPYTGSVKLQSNVTTDVIANTGSTLNPDATTTGVATFSVKVVGIGQHTFTATDDTGSTPNLSLTGSETNTDIAGPLYQFGVTDLSSGAAVDGTTITVLATAEDKAGSELTSYVGSVKLTSSVTNDVIANDSSPSTLTNPATAVAGVATFSVTLKGLIGNHEFTATDPSNSSITGTESTFNDETAPIIQLAVTDLSSGTAVDGKTITVYATAEDAVGTKIPSYTGSVELTSTGGTGVTDADVIANNASPSLLTNPATAAAGVATFSVTVNGAGSRTFTATDAANSYSGSDAALNAGDGFNVTVGPVDKFGVTDTGTTPGIGVDKSVVTVKATAEDAEGSLVSGYDGNVTLTSTGGPGVTDTDAISPLAPLAATANTGVATFSVTLNGAGARTFTAAATNPTLSGSEGFTDVAASGAAIKLAVAITTTAPTGGYVNGEPVVVSVTAEDSTGAKVTNYTGQVELKSVDKDNITYPGSGTPSSYTYALTDKGVKTFKVTLMNCTSSSTCADKITATDQATTAITGNTAFSVVPGAVKKLVVTAPSSYVKTTGIVEGTGTTYTVTPENSYSQPVLSFADKIHIGSSDAWADLPLPSSQTYAATGSTTLAPETFSVTLNSVGSETVTVKDMAANTTVSPGSITIKSIAGSADHLDIIADDNAENGAALNVTVSVLDKEGHPVTTGYAGKVTLSDTLGSVIPTADNGVALTKGVHKFVVPLSGCNDGTCADTFTAADDGIGSAQIKTNTKTSYVVHVTEGAVTQLVVNAGGSAPASGKTKASNGAATKGSAVLPVSGVGGVKVTAENTYGQLVEDFTGTVHFSSNDPLADLPPSYTFTGGPGAEDSALCVAPGAVSNPNNLATCSNGVATFNAVNETTGNGEVTFNTAGTKTLTVTDNRNNGIKGVATVVVS